MEVYNTEVATNGLMYRRGNEDRRNKWKTEERQMERRIGEGNDIGGEVTYRNYGTPYKSRLVQE